MTTYYFFARLLRLCLGFSDAKVMMAVFSVLAMACEPGWAVDGASIARGGRLFDNWYLETKDRPPSKIHPKFNSAQSLMHEEETSWRCMACHGWDYKGQDSQGTGPLSGKVGADPASLESILGDDSHRYDNKLSKRDYVDLAAFVSHGLVDMGPIIEPGSNRILGDSMREVELYATTCANCHGPGGHKITSIPPLGTFVTQHPKEALHKILNGHPAEKMPPLRFLSTRRLGDLLAYAQTLPAKNLSASIARGGRLYDSWEKEKGSQSPTSRHPAYPREATYANSPTANWRCKECHGWDYKGRDGIYGRGRHRTGIKGIRNLTGHKPEEVITLLMDSNHGYHGTRWFKGLLDYQDLMDIANFVTLGQVDMDAYIDQKTGIVKGNPEHRKYEFDVLCATCHGREGDALPTGMNIGDVARENPWEAFHKIRNGHPNEAMPALHILDVKMLVDILAYAQTLPER
jgi:mono/diheme cytochrome c family protein